MLKINKITGLGCEILKAVHLNSKRKAKNYNVKQAQRYLQAMQETGDRILIEYAERKLKELQQQP